jgi:hypothetical protein
MMAIQTLVSDEVTIADQELRRQVTLGKGTSMDGAPGGVKGGAP